MTGATTTADRIAEFLAQKRFAMLGVSRDRKEISARLFHDLRHHGYDVVPVNPYADMIEGVKCHASLGEIEPRVTSALVMLPGQKLVSSLRECIEAGISLVWLYGVNGSPQKISDAEHLLSKGTMAVINGYCPYMFLKDEAFIHRFHGTILKVFGKYPA